MIVKLREFFLVVLITIISSFSTCAFGQCWLYTLKTDLEASQALANKIDENPELIESWKLLIDRPVLRVKPELLNKVDELRNANKLDDFIPIKTNKRDIQTRDELIAQIIKLQGEAGSLVGNRMSSMDELISDIKYLIDNYPNVQGLDSFIKELTESAGKMAGGSFILRSIVNNSDEFGTILKFEVTVSSTADEIGDIVVDLITSKGAFPIVFNEFKNWSSIYSKRFSSFSKQFSGYLTSKNPGEFFYYFKKSKSSVGITDIEELKSQIISAFGSTQGRTELSKIPLTRIQEVINNFSVTESSKVQELIDYYSDLENFEDVFKLLD